MNYKATITLMALAAALGARADILTPAEALSRYAAEEPGGIRKAAAQSLPKLTPYTFETTAKEPAVYIFNQPGGGTLLLSADSDAPALLGYSDSGEFDIANIPPAMEAMLETYAGQIATARLEGGAMKAESSAMERINPLCRTTWDQSMPYNLDCPKVGSQRTMTGCVATAMAQVLKVMEWPAKCVGGSSSYKWDATGQMLELNFNSVELNWGVMKDNYTTTTANESSRAVALLMKALGYAAEMQYSTTASGARGETLATGLAAHFDLDCTLGYEFQYWYTQPEWEAKVYGELAKGIPVYCDGLNGNLDAGHAFVVDGYDGNGFFHLNWGWSGLSDGYYRLNALDPTAQGIGGSNSGYNFFQGAIFGLSKGATTAKSKRPLTFMLDGQISAAVASSALGNTVTFNAACYNIAPVTATRVSPAIKLTNNTTGDERYIKASEEYKNVPLNAGYDKTNVKIPTTLADGTYTVSSAVYDGVNKTYYDCKAKVGGYGFITATVANGTITFGAPKLSSLMLTNVKVLTSIYPNTAYTVQVKVSNPDSEPYSGEIRPALFNTSGSLIESYEPVAVNLTAGQSRTLTLNLTAGSIATGTAQFIFFDAEGNSISTPLRVTISSRPAGGILTLKSISCTDTSKNNLTFEVEVECTTGYYARPVYLGIFRKSGSGNSLAIMTGEPIILQAGETGKCTISSTFASGTPGTTYSVGAYYVENSSETLMQMEGSTLTQFTLTEGIYGSEQSGVEGIEAESAQTEWYDLSGRRIATPSAGGIYLRRSGSKVEKVAR